MEKIIVVFLIGFLLIGIFGGYILNYMLYQPQIQSLRNELDTLNLKLDTISANYQKTIANLTAVIADLSAAAAASTKTNSSTSENQSTGNNETVDLVEQIIFPSAVATKDAAGNFTVDFTLQSTGTALAVLYALYLNGVVASEVPDLTSIVINGTALPKDSALLYSIYPGDTASGTLQLTGGVNFVSGATLEISFVTAMTAYSRGNSYTRTVVLP